MNLAVWSSPEALDQLQASWQQLFEACPAASVFCSWEWVSRWWAHFGADRRPHLITISDGGDVVALAALMASEANGGQIGFMGREETTDYADLLALPGREAPAAELVIQTLEEAGRQGCSVVLEPLAEDSPLLSALHPTDGGGPTQVERLQPCPFISLPATWDSYLADLPKRDRHELRRKLRRAESSGELTLDVATAPGEIAERLPVFFAMHRASADVHKAEFLNPEMQAFFKDVCGSLAQRGWARLSILRLGTRPVASALSFERAGTVALYNSGFEPEFASLSPGIALVALEVRAAMERGFTTYDFLRGDERYKYDLGGRDRFVYRLRLTPASAAAKQPVAQGDK